MEPYTHILLSVFVLTIFGVYQDILGSNPWFHSTGYIVFFHEKIMKKIQCTLCYETMGYSQECLGTLKDREDKNRQQNVCIRFHVPAVRRPTLVRQEGNLGSGYKNTDLKWSRKRIELSPEVIIQVHRLNLIDRH